MAWAAISMGPPYSSRNDLIMIDEPELSLWLHRQQTLLDDLRDLLGLSSDHVEAEHRRFDNTVKNWQKMRQHPDNREAIDDIDHSNISRLSLAPRHLIVASQNFTQ